MRISVLGNAGSGKSTLAHWLAKRCGAALLDLDTVAWEPGQVAVPRSAEAARGDVVAFCGANPRWVVEGCYGSLADVTFSFNPTLLFLNPGETQCVAHCLSRPWESHKYSSQHEQDKHLEFLLSWVRGYYSREGDMSLSGHRACFEAYAGPKHEFSEAITLEAPPPELLACLA
jgi:adenylate kinase family enzyme